jgi:hypothetical protein
MASPTADGVRLFAAHDALHCVRAVVRAADRFLLISGVALDAAPDLAGLLSDAARRGCVVRVVLPEFSAAYAEPEIRRLVRDGVTVLVARGPTPVLAASDEAACESPGDFPDIPRSGSPVVYVLRREAGARWTRIVARAKLARFNAAPALPSPWWASLLADFVFPPHAPVVPAG